jgi:hypothetical protein
MNVKISICAIQVQEFPIGAPKQTFPKKVGLPPEFQAVLHDAYGGKPVAGFMFSVVAANPDRSNERTVSSGTLSLSVDPKK